MIETAHEPDSRDVHLDVLTDDDGDPAHPGKRLDGDRWLAEPGLAQVKVNAAHKRDGGIAARHHPLPGPPRLAHDRQGERAGRRSSESLGGKSAGGHGRDPARNRQIAYHGLELGVGLGGIRLVKALVEFLERQAAITGGLPQDLGGLLAVGVGNPQAAVVGGDWNVRHEVTLTACAGHSQF